MMCYELNGLPIRIALILGEGALQSAVSHFSQRITSSNDVARGSRIECGLYQGAGIAKRLEMLRPRIS
jgi:hypothetical protein